jgi:hypothetical protein
LEEVLHALIVEVAAQPFDELDHDARAGVAVGEDLTQARALDHRGVELQAGVLEARGGCRQIFDGDRQVLYAGAVVLDELRDLRLRRGALEQHDGDRSRLEHRRDHGGFGALRPAPLVQRETQHVGEEGDRFLEVAYGNGNVVDASRLGAQRYLGHVTILSVRLTGSVRPGHAGAHYILIRF